LNSFLEIICIGNELLIGKTLNINAYWLAKRITSLGLNLRRIIVIGDKMSEIEIAVKEIIQRKPNYVIVTGGLGPTFDDKTTMGIANSLGLDLEINKDALEMIKKKYQEYTCNKNEKEYNLTPHRIKMAMLPKGGKPLFNPVGTAPGILLEQKGINFILLPGVPQEMKAIFDNAVANLLHKMAGNLTFYEASLDVRLISESALAPMIDEIISDNPHVYIKSHPQIRENTKKIELHFSTTSDDSKVARQRIGSAITRISEMIKEKGGKVKILKPK
jgi:molybdenum cofactor synthesis domain-containing protein